MRTNDTEHAYGVRLRDERTDAIRVDIKPSLVMAQDACGQFRKAYADGGTYYADAEVVERGEGSGDWKVLTDADITRIVAGAWEALDQAMAPVLTAGLKQLAEQQARSTRPYVAEEAAGSVRLVTGVAYCTSCRHSEGDPHAKHCVVIDGCGDNAPYRSDPAGIGWDGTGDHMPGGGS